MSLVRVALMPGPGEPVELREVSDFSHFYRGARMMADAARSAPWARLELDTYPRARGRSARGRRRDACRQSAHRPARLTTRHTPAPLIPAARIVRAANKHTRALATKTLTFTRPGVTLPTVR